MTVDVRVIGSGSSEKISLNNECKYVFCNSSVVRAKPSISSAYGLVISDGILQTDKELCSHPPAIGLSSDESLQMRRLKRQSLYGLHINNLVVNTDKTRAEIKKKIRNLKMTYDNLILLDSKARAKLVVDYFGVEIFSVVFRIGLIDACKFILTFIVPIHYKPPSSIRASTGMLAYLWAQKHFNSMRKIILDGIGDGSTAYYPGKNRQYNPVVFNKAHVIDDYIFEKYNRLRKTSFEYLDRSSKK